jgi:hypothetical protein
VDTPESHAAELGPCPHACRARGRGAVRISRDLPERITNKRIYADQDYRYRKTNGRWPVSQGKSKKPEPPIGPLSWNIWVISADGYWIYLLLIQHIRVIITLPYRETSVPNRASMFEGEHAPHVHPQENIAGCGPNYLGP